MACGSRVSGLGLVLLLLVATIEYGVFVYTSGTAPNP